MRNNGNDAYIGNKRIKIEHQLLKSKIIKICGVFQNIEVKYITVTAE